MFTCVNSYAFISEDFSVESSLHKLAKAKKWGGFLTQATQKAGGGSWPYS